MRRIVLVSFIIVALVSSFSLAAKPKKLSSEQMNKVKGVGAAVLLPYAYDLFTSAVMCQRKSSKTTCDPGAPTNRLAKDALKEECLQKKQEVYDKCMDERILDAAGKGVAGEVIEKKVSKTIGKALNVVGIADNTCELLTDKKCGDALAYSGGVKVYIKSLDKTCTLVDKDKVVCPTDTPCLTTNPPTGNGCDAITQQTLVRDPLLGTWSQPGVKVSNDKAAQPVSFTPVFPTEKCEFEIPSGTKTSCYPKVTSRKTTSSGGSGSSSLLGRLTGATGTPPKITVTNSKTYIPTTYTVGGKTYTGLQNANGQGVCAAPQNVTCAPNLSNTPATLNPLAPAAQNQVCVVNTGTTTAKKTTSHSDGGSPAPSSTGGTPKTTTAAPPVATAKPTTPVKNTSGYGSNPSGTVQKAAGTVVPANKSLKDYSPAEARAISNR